MSYKIKKIRLSDLTPAFIAWFCSQVERPENRAQCWRWRGHEDRLSPKRVKAGKWTYELAYVVSWMIASGLEVPRGLVLCHLCDNPFCISPWHLWLGTRPENLRDYHLKGLAKVSHPPEAIQERRAELKRVWGY